MLLNSGLFKRILHEINKDLWKNSKLETSFICKHFIQLVEPLKTFRYLGISGKSLKTLAKNTQLVPTLLLHIS